MSNAQVRHAIMLHVTAADTADRAARLLDRIKIETRWLLISAPARSFKIDTTLAAEDRAALLSVWPAIRHRRVPPDYLASFYDLVADQASIFAHLIEIRRQRTLDRKSQQ